MELPRGDWERKWGVSTEDDRSGASTQDPGEAREQEIVSGSMAGYLSLSRWLGAHFL